MTREEAIKKIDRSHSRPHPAKAFILAIPDGYEMPTTVHAPIRDSFASLIWSDFGFTIGPNGKAAVGPDWDSRVFFDFDGTTIPAHILALIPRCEP